jgi:hypothetical protein
MGDDEWTTDRFTPEALEVAGVSDLVQEFKEFVIEHGGTIHEVSGGRVRFSYSEEFSWRPPPGILIEPAWGYDEEGMRVGYYTDPDWYMYLEMFPEPDGEERHGGGIEAPDAGQAAPPGEVQADPVPQPMRHARRWSDGGAIGWAGGGAEYARIFNRDAPYDVIDAMDTLDTLAVAPGEAAQNVIGIGAFELPPTFVDEHLHRRFQW